VTFLRYDRFSTYFLKSGWHGTNCDLREEWWDNSRPGRRHEWGSVALTDDTIAHKE
jgi:hypothetical protein